LNALQSSSVVHPTVNVQTLKPAPVSRQSPVRQSSLLWQRIPSKPGKQMGGSPGPALPAQAKFGGQENLSHGAPQMTGTSNPAP
jgi:hypothetical protein